MILFLWLLIFALNLSVSAVVNPFNEEIKFPSYHFTNIWAVEIKGGIDVAQGLAEKHGFKYHGQIVADFHAFQHRRVVRRSVKNSPFKQRTLAQEPNVLWIMQQVALSRVKRDVFPPAHKTFIDPQWPKMWYLNRGGSRDMNVQEAWARGYTGHNIVVTVLDDGIEKDHPDLAANYDPRASFDVNNMDSDPQPRYDWTNENKHGTRCAGEVAATANNSQCGLGVAHGAKIGGWFLFSQTL